MALAPIEICYADFSTVPSEINEEQKNSNLHHFSCSDSDKTCYRSAVWKVITRDPGMLAEFSNPVIPGLAASNPGIYGIEKLSIKWL